MSKNVALKRGQAPAFGSLLRRWRQARRMSQLALATEAEISGRHLSFLETGRAQPSREMIQLLAQVLDLPLGAQNALLLAADFAPRYGERGLAAPELEQVRRALEFILRQQEPYPAIVFDECWDISTQNQAAVRLFGLFLPRPSGKNLGNAMRTLFHPKGLRRFVVNWEEIAAPLIQTVHREAIAGANAAAAKLLDELLAYPGVPVRWKVPDGRVPVSALLTLRLKKDDVALAFFSTITTFATPHDVTVQQLRIECFYPADAVTDATARRLAAS